MTAFAYILGDNISTDLIHPPNFFSLNKTIRKQGLLYGYSKKWAETIEKGSFIIGGKNFGCGSSREVTAMAFQDRGIKLVCARSFARIFYRNMVNLGIPLCTIVSEIPWEPGSRVSVHFDEDDQKLIDDKNKFITLAPLSSFARKIIENRGLLNSIDQIFCKQQ